MTAKLETLACVAVTPDMWMQFIQGLGFIQVGSLFLALMLFYAFVLPLLDRFIAPILETYFDRHAKRIVDRLRARK